MSNRFLVKGINDDESTCQCCGKEGLARVVWIEDTETGTLRHFGTTCAKSPIKGFQLDKAIDKAIREHDKAKEKAERDAMAARASKECEAMANAKIALYESRGGTYRPYTFSNGRTSQIPVDSALMAACHNEVFSKEAIARLSRPLGT